MLFSMARAGDLPNALSLVLPKRRTPWAAATALLVVAAAFLPLGEIAVAASLASFGALLAFTTVNLALIVLRYREPDRKRPFRVPLTVGRLPVLPALGALTALSLMTQFDRVVYIVGTIAGLAALGLYATHRLWSPGRAVSLAQDSDG